jgi:superfamily II DNA helicase RecQ
VDADAIRELARTRFGFSELRPGQLRAVSAAADGRDVLAVLPTGGGKSAIYELAGLLRPGPTVVVSPLIALQDDQVAHLHAAGLTAIVLNSHQSTREHVAALAEASEPDAFVFLSPEQLANAEAREVLRRAKPGLFAVDEAHLISQWGHDFRTDYMRLSAQADVLEVPVRMALTATASDPVRARSSAGSACAIPTSSSATSTVRTSNSRRAPSAPSPKGTRSSSRRPQSSTARASSTRRRMPRPRLRVTCSPPPASG